MIIERDLFQPSIQRYADGVWCLGYVNVTPDGAKRKIWARVMVRRGRCSEDTWSLTIEHANDMSARPFYQQLCDTLRRAREIARENRWTA